MLGTGLKILIFFVIIVKMCTFFSFICYFKMNVYLFCSHGTVFGVNIFFEYFWNVSQKLNKGENIWMLITQLLHCFNKVTFQDMTVTLLFKKNIYKITYIYVYMHLHTQMLTGLWAYLLIQVFLKTFLHFLHYR